MRKVADIEICVDCVMFTANGEVTGSQGEDLTAEHAAKMAELWGDSVNHIHDVTNAETGEHWFSWSSCDGCGSPLGGSRYPAVVLTED